MSNGGPEPATLAWILTPSSFSIDLDLKPSSIEYSSSSWPEHVGHPMNVEDTQTAILRKDVNLLLSRRIAFEGIGERRPLIFKEQTRRPPNEARAASGEIKEMPGSGFVSLPLTA
jgi:hypothetical protein